jgi:hypothetical protein
MPPVEMLLRVKISGSIFGGVALVSALNHAQVIARFHQSPTLKA